MGIYNQENYIGKYLTEIIVYVFLLTMCSRHYIVEGYIELYSHIYKYVIT